MTRKKLTTKHVILLISLVDDHMKSRPWKNPLRNGSIKDRENYVSTVHFVLVKMHGTLC